MQMLITHYCGVMGRPVKELKGIPFHEVLAIMDGYEQREQGVWLRVRHIAAWLISCWTDKPVKAEKILPLAGDKVKQMAAVDVDALRDRVKKRIAKMNEGREVKIKVLGDD